MEKRKNKNWTGGVILLSDLNGITRGNSINDNREKEKKKRYSRVLAIIRVELQVLLISGPPSGMRKGQPCKVTILICA